MGQTSPNLPTLYVFIITVGGDPVEIS